MATEKSRTSERGTKRTPFLSSKLGVQTDPPSQR
jgi:hypothetical protein